ncbi:MAG: HlyC/CorC family transporter [Actinobacteria bacterium]|nr:HlyC/CorC family transporter [Actinomycetota bacterium]
MSDFLRVVLVFVIVLGNAFFVAAEYALVTARRSRLDELAVAGSLRARIALRIMDSPVRFIGTVQLGITVFSIALGAIGEPLVEHLLDPVFAAGAAFAIAFVIVTYLHVTLGELVPKALALTKNESTALWVALPVEAFYVATYPLVWMLQESANLFTRPFGIRPAPAGVVTHSEADLRLIVAGATQAGVLEHDEREMLYKVFDFADKEASDVMVPRPEVVAISAEMPPEDVLAAVIDSPYTRYPVYRESLDDIAGVLHVRDLFSEMHDHGIGAVELRRILRPAYIVPETKDLAALLTEFRKRNQHMAIVVDEYGAMQGIVTLEDLLEEIVGEIEDELDLPDESVEKIDERRIRIDGTFPIDDFNEQFKTALPVEDFHTMAGYVFGQLGEAAEAGDEVLWNGLRFTVVEVEGSRIERLEIEFGVEPEPEPEAEEPQAAEG